MFLKTGNTGVIASLIFAVLGFFIVFFIGNNFIISLICAVIIYVIAYFVFSGTDIGNEIEPKEDFKKEENNELKLVAKTELELQKIYNYSDKISEPEVKKVINDILENAYKIINYINGRVDKINDVRSFLEYYVPATSKIVTNYYTVVENNISSDKSEEFCDKVIVFLTEIEVAFEKQLNALFDDEIIDASIEMEALKASLKSEGLIEDQDI